jgi:hypothetical protein
MVLIAKSRIEEVGAFIRVYSFQEVACERVALKRIFCSGR